MAAIHVYAGSDGESHMQDLKLNLVPVPYGMGIELQSLVQEVHVREVSGVPKRDFRPSARRHIVVQLSGNGQLFCSDGTSRHTQPGDITLFDDLTGRGHRSQGGGSGTHLLMNLDPDFDLASILAKTED